jgi:uncharacterized membrane protein
VNDPARAFAVVAAIFGLALALAMPPGAAPDETRHLSRVFLMSEGVFGVPGLRPPRAQVPKSIPELHRAIEGENFREPPRHTVGEMAAFLAQPLDPERRIGIANAGTYPPVVYLPQLVGVAPARWLGLAPAALIYLGRLTSLAAWIALTALAIRIAPARRWTLALLSLAPMAVAGAASISADPATNAAALLFTAVAMRAATGAGALATPERNALLGAALLVGLVKPGYWPLALAALAIPPPRCGGRARQVGLAAATGAAMLIPSVGWLLFAQRNDPAPPIAGADPVAQLRFVLGEPLVFATILADTLATGLPTYWTTFVGELGPLIVRLPTAVYALWAVLLAAAIALDGPPAPIAREGRLWLAAAFALSIAAMFAMAYLGWNPVADPVIRGVQGRYWAPVVPLLAFALPAASGAPSERVRIALLGGAAASLATALVAIARVYYR